MNKNVTYRDPTIDSIAGIALSYMLWMHSLIFVGLCGSDTHKYISSLFFWFMPYFYFKSGIFLKPFSNIKNELSKEFRRIMIPYLFFICLGVLITIFLYPGKTIISYFIDIYTNGAIYGNAALWFLPSLFISRLFVKFIISNTTQWVSSFCCCMALCIAWQCCKYELHAVALLGPTFLGITFVYAGHFLKQYIYNKRIIYLSLILLVLILAIKPSFISDMHNNLISGNYLFAFLSSLSTIIIILGIKNKKYIPYIDNILIYIGKNSMSFYLTHWMVYICTYKLSTSISSKEHIQAFIICISSIIILPIIQYILKSTIPWSIGEFKKV